jgi:retinal rod rhodopsin-sensitive cGMP 3',5'-cyclic phosphodiesterase subunit delta
VVAREINFSASEEIKNLRLIQKVMMNDYCIEKWSFRFGYVIPNSTNTWEQIIKAACKGQMMSAEVLSGNITIETSFFDEELLVHKCVVRVYYV